MGSLIAVDVALGLVAIYLVYTFCNKASSKDALPLPPGPKRLPLIGNLWDLPKGFEATHWEKHHKLYGPISSVSVFGSNIIILNDADVAFELLEKRSAIYSSRPSLVFGGDLMGAAPFLTLLPYGDTLKASRKILHSHLGTSSSLRDFRPLEHLEVCRLVQKLIDEPGRRTVHIYSMTAAIVLQLAYGYSITRDGNDPLVHLVEEFMENLSAALVPGAWLVDTIPALRLLPDWLPGMGFKRLAKQWRQTTSEYVEKPYAFVKQRLSRGASRPCITSTVLEKGELNDEQDEILKWAASVIYAGGADTTVSAISTFILAMAQNPVIFRRAQAEIDSVIGSERLPTFEDRPNLPYINAIVKESLRWRNVVPTGVVHSSVADDVYAGYRIPKGSLVLPIIWTLTHDPKIYRDPDTFMPERFLSSNGQAPEKDPRTVVFGFGRRICSGKDLADATLFISIAIITAVLDIGKMSENGKVIEPEAAYCSGVVSHPSEFKCSIRPRSEKASSLINDVLEEHPCDSSDAEELKGLAWN